MELTNRYKEFARSFIKVLGTVNLYRLDHPATRKSIGYLHGVLDLLLLDNESLSLVDADGKILVNGEVIEDVSGLQTVLSKHMIHSITFLNGIDDTDLGRFLEIINSQNGLSVEECVVHERIRNIRVNNVHYVKTGEDAPLQSEGADFSTAIEGLSFEAMIRKVIERAVTKEEDRRKIFEIVLKKFQNEVTDKISEATQEIAQEKEDILREKEKAESVVANSVLGLITVDAAGKVVMLNSEAERTVGARLGEKSGKPVWEGLGEGQMVTYAIDAGADALTTKDVMVKGEDETKRLIQASNALIRDVEGRMVGMFSVLSDTTKYKELDRMKRDFVANVTHELRTPIVATKQALGNLLGFATGLDEDQKRMIEISLRNTERLLRLINDILDFSKIEAGKMKITPEIIETVPLLKEVVLSLRPFAQSKGVELVFKPETALPRLCVDRDRTTQVFVNLLSNAVKFTDRGGEVVIEASGISKEGLNAFLRISVRDTGCGIAGGDLEKIFEKFVQAGGKDTAIIKGTGLGLSITRAIVQLHGGSVQVESEAGKGSVFTVMLPMLPEDEVFLKNSVRDNTVPAGKKGSYGQEADKWTR